MRSSFKAAFAGVLGSLLLTGCASEVNYERYSLTLDLDAKAYAQDFSSRIEILPSLATLSGGMLMKTSDVEIVESSNYRYAGPLSSDLRDLFTASLIESGADNGSYVYQVQVSKFWGTTEGTAETAVILRVLDNRRGREIFSEGAEKILPLRADGYRELAVRLKEGYLMLCTELLEKFKDQSSGLSS